MTKDDILRMAREAASEDGTTKPDKNVVLYAAKTRKFLERFAALVAAAEREACAQAASDFLAQGRSPLGQSVAKAIRARGTT